MLESAIHPALSRNVMVSMAANFFYLATRLIVPPFILHYVSLPEYGIWSYCFILIGYIGMSVFGVSNAYVRYGAVYGAERRVESINRLLSTGMAVVAALCLAIVPLIWISLPYLFPLFHIAENLREEAFLLIFGTTLVFLLDMVYGAFNALLQGLQKFVIERSIWVVSFTVETLLIFLLLYAGMGLYGLLLAYAIRTILALFCNAIACYRLLPGLSIGLKYCDRAILPLFLRFGGIVQLTGIISVLNRSIEKVLSGLFLGPSTTALYEVGEKFPIMAMLLPGSMNMVFYPTAAHLHTQDEREKIERIYLQGGRWINMLMGGMMGFMAPFAFPLIACWLGFDPKYSAAAGILACFTIAYQMDIVTGPASAIYRAINQPSRELVYPLLQLVLVLAAAAAGIAMFGASITVINATVASMMVVSALIYVFRSNRFMKISHWTYAQIVLLPGLAPYLIGYLLYLPMQNRFVGLTRWEMLALLMVALAIYTLVLCFCFYFLIFSRDERTSLKRLFHRVH